MPFAICEDHAEKIYEFMLSTRPQRDPTEAEKHLAEMESRRERVRMADEARDRVAEAQSQVYYVRIYDVIKIGYTTNMHARMSQLRVPIDAVLATEPGGRAVERRRHLQFESDRHGRLENFTPSQALLDHIVNVRAEHGDPTITSWPRVG